jgi:superfamily II DNA or RNA helicase
MGRPKRKSKEKSAQPSNNGAHSFSPRRWQRTSANKCELVAGSGGDRALICACPGSGKTFGGLYIANRLIRSIYHDAVVFVLTPNLAIKTQWIDRARLLGIDLLAVGSGSDFEQGQLSLGQSGFIMNYQQAKGLVESIMSFCARYKVIVILDEVHHTGGTFDGFDGNTWGVAVEKAFGKAVFKLCTTGTPFREGNNPIAFVRYDPDNREAIALDTYTYRQAVTDRVCRPIEFTLFDGALSWIDPKDNGTRSSASLSQIMSAVKGENKRLCSQRLRAALSIKGNFLKFMLVAAHSKLEEIRRGGGVDRHAAGFVVAMDQQHATDIAAELEAISGEPPVIVHNRIDQAQSKIEEFRLGSAKWIIGVSMISEGVDIPRLRVGVYASVIRTALFFQQFCGRAMRVEMSERERSFIFMPADSELEKFALEIEFHRCCALGEEYRSSLTRIGVGGGVRPHQDIVIEDSNAEAKAIVLGGEKFPMWFLKQHAPQISQFRIDVPNIAWMSDPEICNMLIKAKAISAPSVDKAA